MAMYSSLLDRVVTRVNMALQFNSSLTYIGTLDVPKSDSNPTHSYEQMCINYCHQKLQQFCKQKISKKELNFQTRKTLTFERIEDLDDFEFLDLNENLVGVPSILDEESTITKLDSDDQSNFSSHFRLVLPKISRTIQNQEFSSEEEFQTIHSGEAVCYETEIKELQTQLMTEIQLVQKGDEMETKNENIYMELLETSDDLLKTLSALTQRDKNFDGQEGSQLTRDHLEKHKLELEKQKSQLVQENKQMQTEIEVQHVSNNEVMEIKKKIPEHTIMNFKKVKKENQNEQEKRDNEIAYRLSQEFGVTIDESVNTELKRSDFVAKTLKSKKYDVSGWKYDAIRYAINTTSDHELLEACREEFHRRLKVYQAWKFRNNTSGKTEMEELQAKSMQHKQPMPPASTTLPQRYFRVPLTRDGQNKGIWFAHFDGPYIARQMETHLGGNHVLLIAGRDDTQMCQLKLNETGLTRKRGAEILEYEFEKEWKKNGGEPYNYSPYRT